MSERPSPTDEDRELIERLRRESNSVFPSRMRDGHAYHATAYTLDTAADRLESLLSDRAKLEGALKRARQYIESGGYNSSGAIAQIDAVLNRSTDRAT